MFAETLATIVVSTLFEVFYIYIYIYRHTLAETPAGDSAKQPEPFAQIRYRPRIWDRRRVDRCDSFLERGVCVEDFQRWRASSPFYHGAPVLPCYAYLAHVRTPARERDRVGCLCIAVYTSRGGIILAFCV